MCPPRILTASELARSSLRSHCIFLSGPANDALISTDFFCPSRYSSRQSRPKSRTVRSRWHNHSHGFTPLASSPSIRRFRPGVPVRKMTVPDETGTVVWKSVSTMRVSCHSLLGRKSLHGTIRKCGLRIKPPPKFAKSLPIVSSKGNVIFDHRNSLTSV